MARGANIPAPTPTPACVQELEERVANVRERGRILTDFLYSMGSGNTSPSPAGVRPRGQRTVSPGGGGTAHPPSVPGRVMSRLGTRSSSAGPPHGRDDMNEARDSADDLRQRLSPPFARTSDCVEHAEHRLPSQRASQRAREEERHLAAAIQASLAESDDTDGTARRGASAWGSPPAARPPSDLTSTSLGENLVDFPAGGGVPVVHGYV